MSGDVLSQAEVESLLSAMDAREADVIADASTSRSRHREKISPYDFKRPERVGKEQMRSLQTMHEAFGRNFGASLSALLRTIVELKLTSVDQLTYSEFVFSLENPTCFNLINAAPLEGQLILDINLSLLFPIIDRLLGGGSDPGAPIRRPLTEIELRLVSRITDLFCKEMKHAWENVLDLDLSIDRVESNPQLVQIVPPNEVVVLDQLRAHAGRRPRHDEPLHPVQCDRTDQHPAVIEQLGQLRQEDGHGREHPAHQQPAERSACGSRCRPGRDEHLDLRPDRPAQWATSSRRKKTSLARSSFRSKAGPNFTPSRARSKAARRFRSSA